MERLQGPINPCFIGENLNVECFGQGESALDSSYGSLVNAEMMLRSEEEEHFFSNPNFQDKMPFLQMLQSVESPSFSPFTEPNLEVLLTRTKTWERNYLSAMDCQVQALELESCVTHDISEAHSPVKSETKEHQCPEVVSCVCNREPNSPEKYREGNTGSLSSRIQNQESPNLLQFDKPLTISRERRKRKRSRPSKNREEVESQRMTHIAVERNRRRQMNDHLNALRSLMPASFVQRGDQASIIGGAIDFVKELEQLLQSLIAQKTRRIMTQQQQQQEEHHNAFIPLNGFFTSPQYTSYSDIKQLVGVGVGEGEGEGEGEDEFTAKNTSTVADIQVIVIQTHVNLKILSPTRPGQLLKAIAALEDLRLTILHLNVTSLECFVFYSFNLKIEDECKLGTADEIATAVHQIFSFINRD